jgi:hypothetical protein
MFAIPFDDNCPYFRHKYFSKKTRPLQHAHYFAVSVDFLPHSNRFERYIELGRNIADHRQAKVRLYVLNDVHHRKVGAGYENRFRLTRFSNGPLGRSINVADRCNA